MVSVTQAAAIFVQQMLNDDADDQVKGDVDVDA